MYPDIEYVMKKRYLLNMIVRLAALLLCFMAVIPVIELLIQLVMVFNVYSARGRTGTLDFEGIIVALLPALVTYGMPGVILLVLRVRIVGWIAPLPRAECPHCGYSLKQLSLSRCPECGNDLPEAMIQRDQTAPPE